MEYVGAIVLEVELLVDIGPGNLLNRLFGDRSSRARCSVSRVRLPRCGRHRLRAPSMSSSSCLYRRSRKDPSSTS